MSRSLDAPLSPNEEVTLRRVALGISPMKDLAPRDLMRLKSLALVEIDFPRFRDGRGYSSARILREAGYDGELRAVGDVLVDQLAYMRRCGFDSFAPDKPFDPADAEAALSRWDHVYVPAADDRVPIWKLRHG